MSDTARIIAESRDGRALEMDAEQGAALIDVCDAHAAPIPFACRSASCGTCRVEVLEGGELLLPPAEDELDLLCVFDADPSRVRLACQALLRAGAGTLRVRAIEE